MKKLNLSILFFIFISIGFSQNNLSWKGYFSFNEIKEISYSTTTLFAASENALFSKNIISNEIKTLTTVDGLSGETISSIYHSIPLNKTIVGYLSGLIIVINDVDGKITKIVDIINKELPAGIKKINHFMEYEGIVYASCDFGIVQFNLNTLLFGDTYFIGNNGAEIKISQTAVYNGYIYASTVDGIRRALITNKNLIDYNQWQLVVSGNWSSIESFGTDLIAINTLGNVHKYNSTSNTFQSFIILPNPALDLKANENYLIITTSNSVFIYNKSLAIVRQINKSEIPEVTSTLTCSTVIGDEIFIGTIENGLFTSTITSISPFINSTPSGPQKNNIFSIDTGTNSLWAVFGSYDLFYNPTPLKSFGISKYNYSNGWLNIPYEKVFGAKSISKITINPNNENEVYACSFHSGLLKIENDIPTKLYDEKNSGLESFSGALTVRINSGRFDKSGNLWVTNSLVKNGLKMLSPNGEWLKISTEAILGSNQTRESFGTMAIDKNNTKWMGTNRDGVIGYNEKTNKFLKIGIDETGNLPSIYVKTVAIDNNNQLWIGTQRGLRVLSNTSSFLTEDELATKPIIILEEGVAQELMYEQFITDLEVDGANNKWIGTSDSGIFLVSPDGQKTLYHFTPDNSPLPGKNINDIAINNSTGEVFIATNKGMVSFKSIATKAKENLNEAYVYPNPVRPEYNGTVKISGLIDKANIKITDIEGNLVYETISEGGTIEWDTTAFGKYKVASGVYMIFIAAEDGIETKVKKVMIIR